MLKPLKSKKCAVCKSIFYPKNSLHKVCSPDCAIKLANKVKVKRLNVELRLGREKLKTRSDWLKTAQKAFNDFIRFRDKDLTCICCGLPLGDQKLGGGYDAGHYRSVGSAPHLRFNEDNCHAQRKICNQYGSGRAVDYRIGLIKKIGIQRVEALECDNKSRKYTIEELKDLVQFYRKKLKTLKDLEQ